MKKRILIGVAVAVLVSLLVSTALAQGINTGPGKTNIFMQNLGSGHAQVTVNFYREETGNLDWSYPIPTPIPPKGSRTLLYPNFQLPENWAGAAELASTEPLAAIVNMFWDGNRTAAAYSGLDTPATEAYLPNLLKRGGADPRQTRVTIQNTEASQASVTLRFYRRDGILVHTFSDTIQGKAERTYNLDNIPQVDFSTTAGAGSLHITSNTKIAALATLHYPNGSAAYSGVSRGDTVIWAPGIWRKQVAGAWNIYSAFVIQNLGNSTANITVECLKKATPADPNPPSHVFTDTIPSKAAYGVNTVAVGTMPPAKWQNMVNYMGTNWNGTFKVTSDQQLAGVVMYFNLGAAPDLAAYEAVRNSDATTNALSMPAVYRKRLTPPIYWQWSVTFVQNLDNAAGTINVKFFNTQGNPQGDAQGYDVNLPANSSVALNLIYAAPGDPWSQVFPALGDSFSGAMYITSTSGRHIIGNTIFYIQTTRQGLGYSGFPVQQ